MNPEHVTLIVVPTWLLYLLVGSYLVLSCLKVWEIYLTKQRDDLETKIQKAKERGRELARRRAAGIGPQP